MAFIAMCYLISYPYADFLYLFVDLTLNLWFNDFFCAAFLMKKKGNKKCLWTAALHTLSHPVRRLSLLPRSGSSSRLYSLAKCLSFSPLTSAPRVSAVCSTQTPCFTERLKARLLGSRCLFRASGISEDALHHQSHYYS